MSNKCQFFYDWIKVSQEHSCVLPQVADIIIDTIDVTTGERVASKQPPFMHEGSYSTKIKIQIRGQTVTLEGNLSRFNRLDNLFGFSSLDQMMMLANSILAEYGIPSFTKCTRVDFRQTSDGNNSLIADGAYFQRLDITTNIAVGKGNIHAYLRSLSTQKAGHSIGYLYPNGQTVDWRTEKGGARLIYRKAYNKAHDLKLNLLNKVKRVFGDQSKEHKKVLQLIEYCEEQGIVRFEQELKREFLQREGCYYWGLFEESKFMNIQQLFLNLDNQLKVTAIDYESIIEALLKNGICNSVYAASTTAIHAMDWKLGRVFQGKTRAYEKHRARLRKIGIDIAIPYDKERHSLTIVTREEVVVVNKNITPPSWYQMPSHLRAVA